MRRDTSAAAGDSLDAALGEQGRVQLQDVLLEELLVDVGIEVGLLAHQLTEPLEADLAVGGEHGSLGQTGPDLVGLGRAQP